MGKLEGKVSRATVLFICVLELSVLSVGCIDWHIYACGDACRGSMLRYNNKDGCVCAPPTQDGGIK